MPSEPPAPLPTAGQRQRAALVRLVERRQRVWALRGQGHSLSEIGAQLGVAAATVCRDLQAELTRVNAQLADDVTAHRQRDLALIDVALEALAPKVATGDAKAVNALCRCLERRAKLLGLDSPTHVHVTADPLRAMSDDDLAAEIARLQAAIH